MFATEDITYISSDVFLSWPLGSAVWGYYNCTFLFINIFLACSYLSLVFYRDTTIIISILSLVKYLRHSLDILSIRSDIHSDMEETVLDVVGVTSGPYELFFRTKL